MALRRYVFLRKPPGAQTSVFRIFAKGKRKKQVQDELAQQVALHSSAASRRNPSQNNETQFLH